MEEAYMLLYQWINYDNFDELRDKYQELYRDDLDNFNYKFNLIIEIYRYVIGKIKTDRERIEYYFKERNVQNCTFAALALLMDMGYLQNDIPSYEERIKPLSLADRVYQYAAIINGEEAANTPNGELSDESGLIAFLEASAFDSQTKWEAVKIFSRQEAYYNEVAGILAEVMELLRSKYTREINELSMSFYNYWSSCQENSDIIEAIRDRLKISWKLSDAGQLLVPVIFSPIGVSIAMNGTEAGRKDIIRIGIMLDNRFVFLYNRSMSKEDVVEIGKLLSDKSKLDILELVSQRPCYGKELANALGLSTATISYHVNALLKAGCLKAEVMSNKVYYSIDNEKLSAYMEGIKSFFSPKKA